MRNHCSDAWSGVHASSARKRKNFNGEGGMADEKLHESVLAVSAPPQKGLRGRHRGQVCPGSSRPALALRLITHHGRTGRIHTD
ncbi:hypothetical protein PROAA_210042 [Candidatus Propionivibrio aalborgensis]|uniref:Uncharacterized protein n=1 Tax=Candidatus Propionivibrio aalborgensis TaxID=1860101 RepID=A0A1A8XPQ8_9RHOO|nr:hypothetical protein PROAA_210042 [Candidatus Propionivibrio aalborgensis]